ncbi:MAG: family 65 glycosyl hydrolase [Oscillospiraceae bacterium]|nr:family 65 glycosyl hydrolase [Oscillospiraceae bacterium]
MGKVADKYFITDPWRVVERGFDPAYSRVSESVFALSNESMGTRGCFDEGGGADSLRGLYVNGVYEYDDLPRSYRGIIDKAHFMIPAADWLLTKITLDGEVLDLAKSRFDGFCRELDVRAGTLTRKFVWHTNSGKDIELTFIRFLDMTCGCRAYQRIIFKALNFDGSIELNSGITFDIKHEGRGACFWGETKKDVTENAVAIQSRTLRSELEVFAGALQSAPSACFEKLDEKDAGGADGKAGDKTAMLATALTLKREEALTFDKRVVVIFDGTSGEELWQTGQNALLAAGRVSLDDALLAQKEYWESQWRFSDVQIEPPAAAIDGDTNENAVAEEQQGIRYCIFQMIQTYNGGSIRHNIGAKGLTGESYNGHAFWDTEACCLPFYLFTNPEAARSLLTFRYNTLPQAINRAKMLDCDGACYPIATLNGDEACNLWQHASLQFQPSTAVAYGIRHYLLVTGDWDFIWEYGAQMLAQIARFLTSRAAQNPHTGQYGYYGVMGPDEFQMMVNNNAYTNYMGKRSLEFAADTLAAMKREKPELYAQLARMIGLSDGEIDAWRNIAENMAMPMTKEGLFEQHDGYFNLPHIDIHSIPVSDFPLYDNWSYDRIYRNDMIKQPDVLMFLYLYSSSFSDEVKRINYEFYEPRTIHESSLSPAVHSILAAELGRMEEATDFFGFATRLDLDNYNRNTNEGLHTTSIAMAWINIVYGFAGLRSDSGVLRFAPRLPKRWGRLAFSIAWRGRIIAVEMCEDMTAFTLMRGEQMEIMVYGKEYTLGAQRLEVLKIASEIQN